MLWAADSDVGSVIHEVSEHSVCKLTSHATHFSNTETQPVINHLKTICLALWFSSTCVLSHFLTGTLPSPKETIKGNIKTVTEYKIDDDGKKFKVI